MKNVNISKQLLSFFIKDQACGFMGIESTT